MDTEATQVGAGICGEPEADVSGKRSELNRYRQKVRANIVPQAQKIADAMRMARDP